MLGLEMGGGREVFLARTDAQLMGGVSEAEVCVGVRGWEKKHLTSWRQSGLILNNMAHDDCDVGLDARPTLGPRRDPQVLEE